MMILGILLVLAMVYGVLIGAVVCKDVNVGTRRHSWYCIYRWFGG